MTSSSHKKQQPALQHDQAGQQPSKATDTTPTSKQRPSETPREVPQEVPRLSPPAVTHDAKGKARTTTTKSPIIDSALPFAMTIPSRVPPGYVLPYKRYRDWKGKKTYDVVRPIAAGGYGSALEVQLNSEPFALKVCDASDPTKKESYDREAKALRMTDNCFIIKLHAAFQERGHLCLVLELANKSLENVLRQTKRMPLNDAKHYARGVAAGLDYLHQKSIVHRDIKPNNILLCGEHSRDVKLADFGLAIWLGGKRKTIQGACGTDDYQAPEMSGSTPYNSQVDVFSFGVTMYRMVTGRLPKGHFARRHGISAKSFFDQVLHKNPDVRFDIQQAMTHAFLKTCDGEGQGTEDSIGSLLSKRTSDAILDEREQKRARQDNQPNEADEQLVARVITIPTTIIPITTAPKSSFTQAKVVHSH